MIQKGALTEMIRNGIYFSMTSDDRVFTGDLFFNMAIREFQIRGVPCIGNSLRHCFGPMDNGPYSIHLLITNVIQCQPRGDGSFYADLRFTSAKCSGEFAAWIEEWHGDRSIMMQEVLDKWQVTQDLTWHR